MTVEQLKEHFKLKEDNAAKKEVQHAKNQHQKSQKRAAEGSNQGTSQCKRHKKDKGKGKGEGKQQAKPPPKLPKGTICPIHGGHLWEDCAQNPANKGRKDLDKFQPKNKSLGKSTEAKKETHNVELTEQPMEGVEVSVTSSTHPSDETIGKSIVESENTNQNPTNHSNIHHLDCLHLQEVETCALTVESTASLA